MKDHDDECIGAGKVPTKVDLVKKKKCLLGIKQEANIYLKLKD
jgi:hypothetical protein